MASVTANGIKIEYEDHGNPDDPAILLIMGLAAQLVLWPPKLIETLVGAGFRVVAFDNRDIGLSHKFHGKRTLHPLVQLMGRYVGLHRVAPYDLHHMAQDTVGLLDALHIPQAHLIGASMGGMIGQLAAARSPERVKSLTAIMSNTGNPNLPRARPEILRKILLRPAAAKDRDAIIDQTVDVWKLIGTPGDESSLRATRERLTHAFDRSYYPQGPRRQVAAIMATGDFRSHSRLIKSPTLVVHGSIDPLAPKEGGEDIARTVPGARLEIIDGMAHDLPEKFLPEISDHILTHIRAVERGDVQVAAQ